MANLPGGYRHYSGVYGSKQIYVGADASIYNFTAISDAVTAAQNNDSIFIEPGTYTLTAILTINKPLALIGMGAPNTTVITSALTTRTIFCQNPATGTAAATYNYFKNLYIGNTSTGDAIEIDNDGGLAQTMVIKFDECTILSDGGTSLDLDQTTNTSAVNCYIQGKQCFHTLGASDLGLTMADSFVAVDNMMISGALAYSATNVAYIITLRFCNVVSAASTTGGSASALCNYYGCTTQAAPWAQVIAASAAGDFDATAGTETVLSLA